MFNLDEIDVDFNDETFGILNTKFGSANNPSIEKGILSFGVCSNQIDLKSNSSKKRCIDNQFNTQKSSELKNINEYQDKFSINYKPLAATHLSDTDSSINYSPLHSPFTSTQINTGPNVQGYLFDRSNVISPIKSQTNFNEVSGSVLGNEMKENSSSDKKSFSFKSLKKIKLQNSGVYSHPSISNQNYANTNENLSIEKGFNSIYNQNKAKFSDSFSSSFCPLTSTQKHDGENILECLFNENNPISPIKMKPGICSELRKPLSKFLESKNPINKFDKSKIRKFPGPAGCLPKVENFESYSTTSEFKEFKLNEIDAITMTNELSNDASINNFPTSSQPEQSETWKLARNVIGDNCWPIFLQYTVQNVLKKVVEPEGLFNSKIPVICLALMGIEYLPMDAAAKMADKTGSIKCAIHRYVLEKYNEKIKTGSIFILKKVSIFSPSGKKYYLNIIQSNIIDIISPDSDMVTISQSLITKHDIDDIIKQCSEVPRINFDPSTAYDELKIKSVSHPNKQPPSISEIKDSNGDQIDFFDDDMDEILMSFMDESFAD